MTHPTPEQERFRLLEHLDRQLAELERRETAAVERATEAVQENRYGTAVAHLVEAARVRTVREELTVLRMGLRQQGRRP